MSNKTLLAVSIAAPIVIGTAVICVLFHENSFLKQKVVVQEQAIHDLSNTLDGAVHQIGDLGSEISRLKETRPVSATITPSTLVTKVDTPIEETEEKQKPFKVSCFNSAGKQIYLAMADGIDSMEGASFINVNKVGAKDDDLEQFITFPNGIYCITGLRGEK